MISNWTTFEDVVAHILHAQPNVELDCLYLDGLMKRQFDGYRLVQLEPPLSPLKIGIEAKYWNTQKIDIEVVEAYSTRLNRCSAQINKLLIITSNSYTSGAVREAKTADIDLLEFHQSTSQDLENRISRIIISTTVQHPPEVTVSIQTKVVSPSLTEKEKTELAKIQSIQPNTQNDHLYDNNGLYTDSFAQLLNAEVKKRIWNRLSTAKSHEINLLNQNLFFKRRWKNKVVTLQLESIEFTVKPKEPTIITTEIGDNPNPADWYVLRNVITGEHDLRPVEEVRRIIDRYNLA
jgi:hypothetical protein